MKSFNNIIEKFARSSLVPFSEKYYFNDEDILTYFEKVTNAKKLINIPRFDLKICYDTKDTDNYIYSIDYKNKIVYFNKELFFEKYVDEKSNILDSYKTNLQLIEKINDIISRIELYRQLCNPICFKLDPIFFNCICKNTLNETDNEEAQYFISLYSKYLTTKIIECATSNYEFNPIEEMHFNLKTNKLIIDYLEDDYYPLIESLNKYYKNNYLFEGRDYEEIEKILGTTISKNYIDSLDINIKNQKINYHNLLGCILYGKPITKDVLEDLKHLNKKNHNIDSIFLYTENIQLNNQKELIRKLTKLTK